MDQNRVTYRLLENVHRVVLDHGDEIVVLKKTIDEIKSYFSPKMLIIYFSFILAQVITVSYYIAQQEAKIEAIMKKLEKK
jgi:hypothetical protein